jgi:alpha-glucosidase
VYPGPDCRGSLYMDDGTSFEYQKGAFLRLKFTCTERADSIVVRVAPAEGSYVPWFQSVRVSIQGAKSARSVTVPYDKSGFEVSLTP